MSNSINEKGLAEYVNSSISLLVDLWNLNEALEIYKRNPNDYRPKVLPTSKFTKLMTSILIKQWFQMIH